MSGHVPVAQPEVRLDSSDAMAGWRRSLPWWDLYFAAVTVGTMAFAGSWGAIAVLASMALWYIAFGRRVCRRALPVWQQVLYLAVATVLLAVAVSLSGGSSFILFALSAQAHMVLAFGWAVLATTIMNLTPTAMFLIQGEEWRLSLSSALLAIGLTTIIGYSIDHLIGQSVQLAESRAEVARLSREAERRRLGADLHDTIAQGLSSILMLVQAADAALDRDILETRRHLDLAARTARENLREIRAVLDALMPTEQDLPEALRRMANRLAEETGLAVGVEVTGDPRRLEIAAEVVLLRAVQESLSNIRRHARATTVSIGLRYEPSAVRLKVSDDGCGFEPAKIKRGYGLEAMRSRVAQAGGTVEVDSGRYSGSSIRVVIPA
ncbi:MAG TPA: sensor histidine kinase [Candidatus Limnocylindrales bacterium]|nr:sensor histidine kinase [Candidatus Limnocylindrales bacterium]